MSSEKQESFFDAVKENYPLVVLALLNDNPELVNIVDSEKHSPLYHATIRYHEKITVYLLKAGANIQNTENEIDNNTPLDPASKSDFKNFIYEAKTKKDNLYYKMDLFQLSR